MLEHAAGAPPTGDLSQILDVAVVLEGLWAGAQTKNAPMVLPFPHHPALPANQHPASVLSPNGGGDSLACRSAQNCGVGVLFSINEKGELTVAALVPGSPAEQSTLVRVGE
jgi:hypothetical protein